MAEAERMVNSAVSPAKGDWMETELEMVMRHIRQGEAHIVGQQKIMARLRLAGCSTDVANDLLAQFENTLRLHNDHLDRLLR